jgi:hypothetical protein
MHSFVPMKQQDMLIRNDLFLLGLDGRGLENLGSLGKDHIAVHRNKTTYFYHLAPDSVSNCFICTLTISETFACLGDTRL